MAKQVKQLIYVIFILCISISEIQAQYSGYGNGYGSRSGRQGRTSLPQAQTPPQEPEVKTPEQLVDEQMPKISEAVNLSPFEEAVVRSIYVKYVQKRSELQILKLEPQKIQEAYQKLQKEQNEEFKAGLPEDKYLAIIELQENRFKTKKKKKKKKKKKS